MNRKIARSSKVVSLLLVLVLLAGCGVRSTGSSAGDDMAAKESSQSPVRAVNNNSSNSNNTTSSKEVPNMQDSTYRTIQRPAEVRGVWISYLEMQTMLEGKTEAQFTKNIQTAFDDCKEMGLNTIYAQVRPFGDALYDSQYFPWSHTINGTEGENPGFDPLDIMVREAHSRGLLLEAWINPYRIRMDRADNKPLAATNQARKWLNVGDNSVVQYKNLISYNPASKKAQTLIINGVREIVEKYPVDGIHIDDYFYPVTGTAFDTSFDKPEYDAYKKNGGTKAFEDWRRENVETLVQQMYSAVKEVNPNVYFGISPQSNMDTNYNQQYFDVAKITSVPGYCDYIAPQIYFGFNNAVQPYAETLAKWEKVIGKDTGIDLYVGIASYKVGTLDKFAGKDGENEWKENTDLTARQIKLAREKEHYAGFALFRYDHLFKPAQDVKDRVEKEKQNIKNLLK